MDDSKGPAGDLQRYSQQRTQVLAEKRIHHLGLREIGNIERLSTGYDTSGYSLTGRYANLVGDRLLRASNGVHDQHLSGFVEAEDRHIIHLHDPLDSLNQPRDEIVDIGVP
jgi:hypothetical protein